MRGLTELWNRLRDRLRRDELGGELDEELRFHEQMLMRDRQDPRRLGNRTRIREAARAMWTLGWFDDFILDIRYAARVLRRDALATLAIIVTLALGIGANAALFAVVDAVILRPLPYAEPERLVSIWTAPAGTPNDRNPSSYGDLVDWRERNRSFESIGAVAFNRYELSGPEGAEMARAAVGTRDLGTLLGAQPVLGRMPAPDDERAYVVAISHRIWMNRYGGAPDVLGRTVQLNERPFTIIGVMPPGFHYPTPDIDLWTSFAPMLEPRPDGRENPWITGHGLHGYRAVGRLRPGVTREAAERELNAIERELAVIYPDDRGTEIHLEQVRDDAMRNVARPLWLMLSAAGVLLLLACVNVAHLTLVRAVARRREIAVRRALGAERHRVVRQLLTENLLLGLLGGAVGLLVAQLATRLFVRLSPADIPRVETVHVDGATLLFALGASIATSVLFGLAPSLVAWRDDVQSPLREQGRTAAHGAVGPRLRGALTTIEVAFALVLLIAGGLMVRSFTSLLSADLGIRSQGVVSFGLALTAPRYPDDAARVATLDRVLDGVRALPGVVAAGASTSLPPVRIQQASAFSIDGEPPPEPGHFPSAIYIPATPGFTTALGIPLERGRVFDTGDGPASPPVAVITHSISERYFRNADPIGRTIRIDGVGRLIVGVVGDAVYKGVTAAPTPQVYLPFSQAAFPGIWVAVRTSGDPSSAIAGIRSVVREVDPRLNPRELRSMDDVIGDSVVRPRFQAWLLGAFGALALALAAAGIYGIVAYGVTLRTGEIGVRAALGASRRDVLTLVLRGGMTPVLVGIAIGLPAAALGARSLAGLLYGVAPVDTMTYAGVSSLLLVVALVASIIPARRAARIDPMIALRSD
jgi:putative ABC transport system permease protein